MVEKSGQQSWYYNVCKTHGEVPMLVDEGVLIVILKIKNDHTNRSPTCNNVIDNIRVIVKKDSVEGILSIGHILKTIKSARK